jgi:pilus assembly protein FimV
MAPTREQIVQTAEKFVSRGKIEAAIREYKKVLAENPNDNNTLNRVGDLYARIQRIDEAVDFFTQIAQQYADEGFFVKAIAIYKKIIKLNPTHLEVYEKLAELYHKQGLVNEARTQYHVLADYYLKHENPTSAIAIYLKMTELEPENPTYHVKLAELYQQQKLTEKALNEHRVIAELMLGHGHPQEAVQVYERGLDIDANSLGFIADAVAKLQEAGHHDAVKRFLAFAIERNPEAATVSRELGRERESELQRTGSQLRPPPVAPIAPIAPAAPEPGPEAQADEFEAWGNSSLDEMVAPAAAAEEPAEIELDLDEVFVLDMEADDEPASLVKPPADLAGLEVRRPAWAQAPPESKTAESEEPESDRFDLDSTFDLDALEVELAPAQSPSDAAGAAAPAAEQRLEIDPDLLEQTAAELSRPAREREEDLITEAEVLAKYGLEDKALERLQEALVRHPGSLPAYELTLQLHLEKGRHAQVAELATRMLEVAATNPRQEPWQRMRRRLLDNGFRVEGEQVLAPPSAPQATLPEEIALEEIAFQEQEIEVEEIAVEEPEVEDLVVEPEAPAVLPEIADWTDLPEIEEAVELPDLLEELEGLEELELPEVAAAAPPVEPEAAAPPVAPPPVPISPVSDAPPVAPAPVRPSRRPSAMDDLLKGLIDIPKTPRARPPAPPLPPPAAAAPATAAAAPPPPAPAPPPAAMIFNPLEIGEMVDSADLDEIPDVTSLPPLAIAIPPSPPAFSEPSPPGRSSGSSGASLDDTAGMSWLDEVEAGRNQRGAPRRSARNDDFFDLAGELEEELSREVGLDGSDLLLEPAEQSLEQIVEGFKKGVAENLSPTDFETHFNLGIAYREMGLLDEAIGEFQLSAKSADLLVSCCSMLGLCFLDKGLPELAIKWYGRGLEAPHLSEEDHLGLLYDLGNAHEAAGDADTAYKTFVDLYGINSNYRDVVARLAELNPAR